MATSGRKCVPCSDFYPWENKVSARAMEKDELFELAATRGYGPPRLSQYIIFCTDCRQSMLRHAQTNIQKLCCKAAQEESQRESLANFWDQWKQPK